MEAAMPGPVYKSQQTNPVVAPEEQESQRILKKFKTWKVKRCEDKR